MRQAAGVDQRAQIAHDPSMLNLLMHVLWALFKTRAELQLENLALYQQLANFKAKRPRPRLKPPDRWFWVALRRVWSGWQRVLIVVQPDTVVGWHRLGFRLFWRWKSRHKKAGRPTIDPQIRALIRRLAHENPSWGAPRVHGELVKLGFEVSERTVSRYMPRRPAPADAVRRWITFLRNHKGGVAGMDFFAVPTVRFAVLYVFVIIDHERRQILHVNVTEHPTAQWLVQQLREAFPYDTAPKHLIFDRDTIFSAAEVMTMLKAMRIRPCRTSYRSPWQNGVCERWVGSVRRELLDHVVVFNRRHLMRLLHSYLEYYHRDRTHLTLGKDGPEHRAVEARPSAGARVVALPRVGGLHHRYEWRDAA